MRDAQENPAVVAFLRDLDHPLKAEIEAARAIILGVDPAVGEVIKWNSPTFRTTVDFATINLRSTTTLQLIMHMGVKTRPGPPPQVDDPAGLLKWLAADRAMVTLGRGSDIGEKRPAFETLLRDWIGQLSPSA